jgi:hypothetical protein
MEEVTQTRDRGGQGQRLGPVVGGGAVKAVDYHWAGLRGRLSKKKEKATSGTGGGRAVESRGRRRGRVIGGIRAPLPLLPGVLVPTSSSHDGNRLLPSSSSGV